MSDNPIFSHNRQTLINKGIIKLCSYCNFETTNRIEIRRHGIDYHNNKNCQSNDKDFQMGKIK